MQTTSKPFPEHLNPIFLDTANWVCKETIQIKKSLARKYPKPNVFCVWHGKYCSKQNSRRYSPLIHGGKIDLEINKKKQKQQFICRNCTDLWRQWNRCGCPKIQNESEWIQFLKDQNQTDLEVKSDSDTDYVYEEDDDETKKTNLSHQPSYNAEELRIHLMTEEEKATELKMKIFQSGEDENEEEKKKKSSNQIEQLKKKFRPNEDQIIRQKSLENGKEPLKLSKESELVNPHSNYLVDSKQMILLLNNIHCPCGRRKELLDLKERYGSFVAKLVCRKCPATQRKDNFETFHFSKKLEEKEHDEKKNKAKFKTENGQRKIVASVLAGNFYENYREQMEMMGLLYLKKNSYQKTIDQLIKETNYLFQKHLEANRTKMDLKNLTICVDAGWSSRRHANECCFIVIDNKTKLLFDIVVITREIFSGASGNMEAEAARIFCERHKEKINLVGVVKDGDTKLAKIFEQAWNWVIILKDLNHLLKNVRKNIQDSADFKCLKNTSLPLTKWIRSKAEKSWSSLELRIYIKMSIFHFLDIHDCCEHVMPYKDRYDFPPLNIIDKKFLHEKKNEIQREIENYLKILANNIQIVEAKLFSKKMKKNDRLYWMGVIDEIAEKKNFFFFKN
ncbi:hypothetical protein M0813_29247 [Anaeramoeba flamelloides]|uniref:Uncharacterized protein n=1 Tax=Anaeramoeba flamelloides TaxID=1746091 RepID=A0ABQ8XQH1_9EUKA|nr:hypothetical protein M0813_29247 [Anaeramoeba flamelloides]